MPKNHYDIIIIGTSPIMLIEALFHDAQGKSVAIFDERAHFGGAWYSKEMFG
jgi:pyruvate/2-oxoglutarate dehydrogenase complex dihydrolipoamide dehydrogenase (E3) component